MISLDDIRALAALARLQISGEEEVALQNDISNILEYVGQVSGVSASAVAVAPVLRNVMREDVPTKTLGTREALVAAFPTEKDGYNIVRKIIQKDE